MRNLLFVPLLIVGVALAANAQNTSQISHGPVGAIATVEKLDRQTNTAVIRVLNTSQRDIAAFSLSVDALYADGSKAHSEKMFDYGPLVIARNGALHPTEANEQVAAWTVIPGNPLQKVEVRLVAIVYADRTADVRDEEAYQRIVDHRTQFARALQKSAEILANSLADTAAALADIANLPDRAKPLAADWVKKAQAPFQRR